MNKIIYNKKRSKDYEAILHEEETNELNGCDFDKAIKLKILSRWDSWGQAMKDC